MVVVVAAAVVAVFAAAEAVESVVVVLLLFFEAVESVFVVVFVVVVVLLLEDLDFEAKNCNFEFFSPLFFFFAVLYGKNYFQLIFLHRVGKYMEIISEKKKNADDKFLLQKQKSFQKFFQNRICLIFQHGGRRRNRLFFLHSEQY